MAYQDEFPRHKLWGKVENITMSSSDSSGSYHGQVPRDTYLTSSGSGTSEGSLSNRFRESYIQNKGPKKRPGVTKDDIPMERERLRTGGIAVPESQPENAQRPMYGGSCGSTAGPLAAVTIDAVAALSTPVAAASTPVVVNEAAQAAEAPRVATPGTGVVAMDKPMGLTNEDWHNSGRCTPCYYMLTRQSCKKDEACSFCHFPHTGPLKPRPCKSKRAHYKRIADVLDQVDPQDFDATADILMHQGGYLGVVIRSKLKKMGRPEFGGSLSMDLVAAAATDVDQGSAQDMESVILQAAEAAARSRQGIGASSSGGQALDVSAAAQYTPEGCSSESVIVQAAKAVARSRHHKATLGGNNNGGGGWQAGGNNNNGGGGGGRQANCKLAL